MTQEEIVNRIIQMHLLMGIQILIDIAWFMVFRYVFFKYYKDRILIMCIVAIVTGALTFLLFHSSLMSESILGIPNDTIDDIYTSLSIQGKPINPILEEYLHGDLGDRISLFAAIMFFPTLFVLIAAFLLSLKFALFQGIKAAKERFLFKDTATPRARPDTVQGFHEEPPRKPEPAPPHTLHEALGEAYDFARKTIEGIETIEPEAKIKSDPPPQPAPKPPRKQRPHPPEVIYGYHDKTPNPEPVQTATPPHKPKPRPSPTSAPDVIYGSHEKTEPDSEVKINLEPPPIPEPIPMESQAGDEDSQLDSLLRELGIPTDQNSAGERRKKK